MPDQVITEEFKTQINNLNPNPNPINTVRNRGHLDRRLIMRQIYEKRMDINMGDIRDSLT